MCDTAQNPVSLDRDGSEPYGPSTAHHQACPGHTRSCASTTGTEHGLQGRTGSAHRTSVLGGRVCACTLSLSPTTILTVQGTAASRLGVAPSPGTKRPRPPGHSACTMPWSQGLWHYGHLLCSPVIPGAQRVLPCQGTAPPPAPPDPEAAPGPHTSRPSTT